MRKAVGVGFISRTSCYTFFVRGVGEVAVRAELNAFSVRCMSVISIRTSRVTGEIELICEVVQSTKTDTGGWSGLRISEENIRAILNTGSVSSVGEIARRTGSDTGVGC